MTQCSLEDVALYYESTGQGEPLVFIHGLGSSTKDWENQVSYFSTRFQVITPDLRGHGRSDKPPGPYSIPLFARDLARLIRSINIAPVHVVGISLGGMVAFELAASNRELVRTLSIVNSMPELPRGTVKDRVRVSLALRLRRVIVHLMGVRRLGQILSNRLFPKPGQQELRFAFIERWAQNDKQAYLKSLKAIHGWSVSNRLSTITCPTCVIAAEQDYTPISFKEAYVAKLPRAELAVISDSHHFSPIDQPKVFNDVLMSFLSKHSLR